MKAISKCSIGLLMLTLVFVLANCAKEDDYEECNLHYLERLNNNWKLASVQWSVSDLGPDYEDCFDLSCLHFDLNLHVQDSTYSFSYFLTRASNNNTIDTFRHVEAGIFLYDYCHKSNLNRDGGRYPGGYTNEGSIEFFPTVGDAHTSNFQADEVYPLLLGYTFGEHQVSVGFK